MVVLLVEGSSQGWGLGHFFPLEEARVNNSGLFLDPQPPLYVPKPKMLSYGMSPGLRVTNYPSFPEKKEFSRTHDFQS